MYSCPTSMSTLGIVKTCLGSNVKRHTSTFVCSISVSRRIDCTDKTKLQVLALVSNKYKMDLTTNGEVISDVTGLFKQARRD